MFRLYWVVLFLLTAAATHAGYVLFYPGQNFDARVARLVGDTTINRFLILTPDQALQLVPTSAPNDLVAICRYDLSFGPLSISSHFPKGYFTFSIYTATGQQAYAVSDTQAGDTTFKIELSQEPGLINQITGALDDGFANAEEISNAGWRVKVAENKGIVVFWVPLADAIFRPQAEATLKDSNCKRA